MNILYTKSKWEMGDASVSTFLERLIADGYDGAEIHIAFTPEPPEAIGRAVRDAGLVLVAQMNTWGATADEHIEILERQFADCVETQPLLINSQTGSDLFSLEENSRIHERAIQLSHESGIPFTSETHRSRPTSAGPSTRQLLEALPTLELTADFSHWFCVHESDLSNQPENVALAIERTRHIHARVGFEEGPQVSNPLNEATLPTTEKFLALWRRIIEARKAAGTAQMTITPEFGPAPYMPLDLEGKPLAEAWETNRAMLHWLREHLSAD